MSNSEGRTSSHFFKVILPSTLEDKKMGIPVKFVRKFGSELSTVATLIVPNGCVWRVRLKNDGRKIWFHESWNDFVRYYSISIGYFLIFQYLKNSTFHVLMFDTSACEIDYPSAGEHPKNDKFKQDEIKNENDVVILGSTTRNMRLISPLKTKEPQRKKCKIEAPKELEEISNGGDDKDFLALLDEKGIIITRRYDLFSTEERKRAIEIARLFKRKIPTFMVILRLNLGNNGYLYIPKKFAVEYVNASTKFVKLQDSNGREWDAQVYRKPHRKNELYISKGWSEFSTHNNIRDREGDICAFELISKKNVVLKVSVFHATTME